MGVVPMKAFLRDSVSYGLANLVSRGLAFALLPLYTRFLSPHDIGVYELFAAISMSLMVVLPLEITQAVARLRTRQIDAGELQGHVSSAFWYSLVSFGVFALGVASASKWIAQNMLGAQVDATIPMLAAALLFFNGLIYFMQNELRWMRLTVPYLTVSFVSAVTTAAAAVLLMAAFKWGLAGLYVALLVGVALGLVAALRHLPWIRIIRIDRRHLAEMLRFSVPLAVSSLCLILATTMDRLMVARLLDLESLGQYGVAMRIAGLSSLAYQGFQMAVLPATVGRGGTDRYDADLERSGRLFLVIAYLVAMGLGAIAPELLRLIATDTFVQSAELVPIMLVGAVYSAAYSFAPGLWLHGHSWRMAGVGIVVALIGFVCNATLIPAAGASGAALAFAITGFSYATIMVVASDYAYPIGRRYRRLLAGAIFFGAATLGLTLMLTYEVALFWRAVVAATTAVACAAVLLDDNEKYEFLRLIRSLPLRWAKKSER